MVSWREQDKPTGTQLFEFDFEGFEVWLEWNDRVGAYRFGWCGPADQAGERLLSGSTLGYADSILEAQEVVLVALEQSGLVQAKLRS